MRYVYLLQSLSDPKERYTGLAYDVEKRLKEHNAGKSIHTNKHMPWELIAKFGFVNEQAAFDFERYLNMDQAMPLQKGIFGKNETFINNVALRPCLG